MIKVTFTAVSVLLFFSLAVMASGDIPGIYREINHLSRDRSSIRLANMLNKLSGFEGVSIGGGLGPTDNTSLQITAIESCPFIFRGDSIDPVIYKWNSISELKGKPEADQITFMLSSESPAVRLLGLRLVDKSSEKERFFNQLRDLVKSDKYVIIAKISKPWDPSRGPRPLGHFDNDFHAPLRMMASRILEKNGQSSSVDANSVALEGVLMIGRLYEANEKLRHQAVTSLSQLGANSEARKIVADSTALEGVDNDTLEMLKLGIEGSPSEISEAFFPRADKDTESKNGEKDTQ